jgi:hypothetical protein
MYDAISEDFDKTAPLTKEILEDPKHEVTLKMLHIYSLESFLYKSLNMASRFADRSKIDSLGPYAQVMNHIVINAIGGRKDVLSRKTFKNLNLYRGCSLTEDQIKLYEEYVGKTETENGLTMPALLSIYGYCSSSRS